jgi:hypothetical protein
VWYALLTVGFLGEKPEMKLSDNTDEIKCGRAQKRE